MDICVQSGGIITRTNEEFCYASIREAGFTTIDWNIDRNLKPADIKALTYAGKSVFERSFEEVWQHHQEELAIIKKNGLTISQAHAPFPAYVPGHPEVLEFMIGVYKNAIQLCHHAGCKHLVIHGISLAVDDPINTPESIAALNWHLYSSLIPTLLQCDVIVCLENLFTRHNGIVEGVCSDPHEAADLIDRLNAEAGREVFGFLLDIGHLQLVNKNLRTYIPVIGKRLKALHLHDNDGSDDQHLAPMTGKVNWQVLCDCLKDVGYTGDLSFETFMQARIAMDFDMDLLVPWLTLIRQIGESMAKKIEN